MPGARRLGEDRAGGVLRGGARGRRRRLTGRTPRPSTRARALSIRRGYPDHDPALRHAAEEPPLHRRHPRQTARGPGRPEEGGRHRGPQRLGSQALVEARRVAATCEVRSNIRQGKGRLKPQSVGDLDHELTARRRSGCGAWGALRGDVRQSWPLAGGRPERPRGRAGLLSPPHSDAAPHRAAAAATSEMTR